MKTDNLIESLTRLLHKCLICLGDISRYLSEYDDCLHTAEKYYNMAILLDSEIGKCHRCHANSLATMYFYLLLLSLLLGVPLNQLGTLAGRSNSSCDAAFFYLLCLNTTHPFDGAKENLQMLFQRNEKRLAEFNRQPAKNRSERMRLVTISVCYSCV
jgi:hypothetical protein